MEYVRHALETSQRAPLPLILALAISTFVGAGLLVRCRHLKSEEDS